MNIYTIIVISICIGTSYSLPHRRSARQCTNVINFQMVTRDEWGARSPEAVTELVTPVPLVIMHHSYDPAACYNVTECSDAMRYMQDMHMIDNGWSDIGYNFAVGSDGVVYEARGWRNVGAHSTGYNTKSIGIVLIGDWVSNSPPSNQIETAKKLIKQGIMFGHISPEYLLVGHRQVRATECPGDALFNEISTWDRFTVTLDL